MAIIIYINQYSICLVEFHVWIELYSQSLIILDF